MTISTNDIGVQIDDKAQIIVANLQNKVMIFWGDINNKDNIFIGDQAIQRYVSGSKNAVGLIIAPFGTNTITTNVNTEKIFVDDSNFLYMVGKQGDILHVLIMESEILTAIKYLVTQIPKDII